MKNLLITLLILCTSFSIGIAQEEENKDVEVKVNLDKNEVEINKSEGIKLKIKDGAEPDVYIDGKKYNYEIVELIDTDKIESIDVLKGERAMKEYNAPNGVILITSKNVKISTSESAKVKIKTSEKLKPKVFIDGKEVSRATLKKLSPEKIKTITVVKGDKAIEEYDAPNGAVIVTTKKKK